MASPPNSNLHHKLFFCIVSSSQIMVHGAPEVHEALVSGLQLVCRLYYAPCTFTAVSIRCLMVKIHNDSWEICRVAMIWWSKNVWDHWLKHILNVSEIFSASSFVGSKSPRLSENASPHFLPILSSSRVHWESARNLRSFSEKLLMQSLHHMQPHNPNVNGKVHIYYQDTWELLPCSKTLSSTHLAQLLTRQAGNSTHEDFQVHIPCYSGYTLRTSRWRKRCGILASNSCWVFLPGTSSIHWHLCAYSFFYLFHPFHSCKIRTTPMGSAHRS